MDRSTIAGYAFWALLAAAVVVPLLHQRRSGRRNLRGQCAYCGTVLAEAGHQVEGVAICSSCAARTQRRVRSAVRGLIGILGLFVAAGLVATVMSIARGDSDLWLFLGIFGGSLVVMVFVVYWFVRSYVNTSSSSATSSALRRAFGRKDGA